MDLNEGLNRNCVKGKIFSIAEKKLLLIFSNFDLLVNTLIIFSSFLILLNILGLNLSSVILLLPSLFLIYFIPGYQIFFKTFGFKYNFMEKLALTVLFSMIFNVLIGIIAGHLGLSITGIFYLTCNLIIYYFLMFLNKLFNKISPIREYKMESVKEVIPKNFLLFVIIIILLALFTISRYPILYGDDPWFHLILTDDIVETGVIPFDKYRGANGLHLMGAIIHFFSGYPTIFIARYFPIINYLISGIIGFVVFNKIFNNNQIGILGSLLLLIAPYRYDYAQSRYFPTALTLSICLFMMFFYIDRIKKNNRDKKETVYFYFFMGISFFAMIFISEISAILFGTLFIFISLFFTIRNRNEIKDLIFFIGLFLIYGIYNIYGYQSIIFKTILVDIELPFYIYVIIGIVGILFILFINKYSFYPKGSFETWLGLKLDESSLKRAVNNYLIKVLIVFIIIFPIIISILFSNIFEIAYGFLYVFTYMVIPITVVIVGFVFSIFGFIIYIKKHKIGALIYFWVVYSFLILLIYLIYDLLFLQYWLWIRMIMYSSIGLVCAQMAYFIYIYKDKFVKPKSFKKIYLTIFICLILNSLITTVNVSQYKKNYEITFANLFGKHLSKENSFITGFRWISILHYYSEKEQRVYYNDAYFLFPSNQVNASGFNNLRQFKYELNEIDLFLLLDDKQITEGIFGDSIGIYLGKLNYTILEEYYNLPYLNRIFTSKNAMNQSVQVYWVNGN